MNYEFKNQTGDFIIYNPETGRNWDNQLFNKYGYNLTVSHTGMVCSNYIDENGKNCEFNRRESNCLYIRNDKTNEFWNVGIAPSYNETENYKCVHSMEKSEISSEYKGIATTLSFAVSQRGTYEIWRAEIKNNTNEEISLSLFTGIEFTAEGFEQPPYYTADTTSETVFCEKYGALLSILKNPFAPNDNCSGFVASSEPVVAYDGNFEKFIGTLGSISNPYVLKKGVDCSNSVCTVKCRGGVLQNKISIPSQEKKTVYYMVGVCKGIDDFENNYDFIRGECESIFVDIDERGRKRFGILRTSSPEERINNIMNFWAQKQVSYCMLGKKAVRDNAQLAMAMLNFDAELSKKTIIECLCHQYKDGRAILNWSTARDFSITYSDPAMWLMLAVCEYIKETGETEFLDEILPYLDGGKDTAYEHMKKAVEWYTAKENRGINGLPKIYYADWNDALNIPDDNAESVFMAMMVCLLYKEVAELAEFIGDEEYAKGLYDLKDELAALTNKVAYNGEYYIRAISKFGNIGDKGWKTGGEIYVNPQSWSILSEVAPDEYLSNVLKSIDSMESEVGIPICIPAYSEYDERVGRMSGMLPGVFENGGVYNHACCFKIMADCKLGRGDNAVGTLLKVIPDGKNNPSSLTLTEPYLFVNCYLQHKAAQMQMMFSWQTGTSAWALRDYYEGILGLKRSYKGLEISPCMPSDWDNVVAERTFRGDRLRIEYINSGKGETGIMVDGEKIEGSILPQFGDGKLHIVKVIM